MSHNLIELACLWEATVPKPGNVHPGASFADTTYDDFVRSARAIGPVFTRAADLGTGELVLEAVRATRAAVGKNTNLGIILVLAPLAQGKDEAGVARVLQSLTVRDAELVYEAIRLASPGGLGSAENQDVRNLPTVTLLEAMRLGAERDLIARQYVTGFKDLFSLLLPALESALAESGRESPSQRWQPVQQAFLIGLATLGDTLIARKCGLAVMQEAQRRAQHVLEAGWPQRLAGQRALVELDDWLRSEGNRRNPGTMADLLAGAIYLALCRGTMMAALP